MSFERSSGILLHPTSLPSSGGIGDLGPAAYFFIDFLHSAKQSLWQVLPLSPVGLGNSPYSATSAFAGNPLLISLELLAKHGWIDAGELKKLTAADGAVDYATVASAKLPLLRKAARQFLEKLLSEHEHVEVVGAARGGGEALAMIAKHKPDAAFLHLLAMPVTRPVCRSGGSR